MTRSTITLSASARFGHGGKQFVARITGRDPKFTFAREFLGRKEGKRGESTSVVVDEPGLYQERYVDSKGGVEDTIYLVHASPVTGDLCKLPIADEEAMALAKVIGTPAWAAAARVYLIRDVEAWIGNHAGEDPAKTIKVGEKYGALPVGSYPACEVAEAMQRLLTALRGEPEAERVLDMAGGPTDAAARRRALEAERVQLVARLAEIDAELGRI